MNKFTQKIILFFSLCCLCGCSIKHQSDTHQNMRNNIDKVDLKTVTINDVLIGQIARLYIIDDYLFIGDYKSSNKLIHIFDRTNFKHINSIADVGQGPDEMTTMGVLREDVVNSLLLVSDHGKQCIFSYEIDSVLNSSSPKAMVKAMMNKVQFPSEYKYINDSVCIASVIEPIGNSSFSQAVSKWNILTGSIEPIEISHYPKVEKKRVSFDVLVKDSIIVECYSNYDLMTIYKLNGDIVANVYGPNWDKRINNRIQHYNKVVFCGEKIFASYSGGDRNMEYHPTKFHIFNKSGNYIKTIETEHQICDFCYDDKNNRIILNLNSNPQFAYIDLESIF